uniref:Uncharacterized protein n=1 Tax=uncultured Armatimonadetes bacterium TaxID=157466 RepID=A0A6J4IBN6_9BACT|nr:hypothetical protein AVDCRST_MAG63-1770 [uncultured Armatimonadetes bacterium]
MKDAADTTSAPLSCPNCGMTVAALRAEGRMGCATCYRVFDAIVVQATAELHGVVVDEAATVPQRPPLPWPTRRAEARPPAPAPPRKRP